MSRGLLMKRERNGLKIDVSAHTQTMHLGASRHGEFAANACNAGHANALRTTLPSTLSTLTIFEDAYKFYDLFPRLPTYMSWHYAFEDSGIPSLGSVLASKSLNLEHLAVSFMINAEEIFRCCSSTWHWSRLQSLALTSNMLQKEEDERTGKGDRQRIQALLCRCGEFVKRMPKLRTFVLWNGGMGHACAFVYRRGRDGASITWRGTWNLKLSSLVLRAWRSTASKLRHTEIEVKYESIRQVIRSPGDAIYHLDLPCQVIEPASLRQIRREGFHLTK